MNPQLPNNQNTNLQETKPMDFENVPTNDWGLPLPIDGTLPPVESFEIDTMLPAPLKKWVKDASYRMQCPPDYIAVSIILMCGSIIGARCAVKPKAKDNWTVYPNLWGVIVGDPSQRKSGATDTALSFFTELERKAHELFDEQLKAWKVQDEINKVKRKAINKDLSSEDKQIIEKAKRELTQLEEDSQEKPKLKRYKVNDATYEMLGQLCSENPQGLLSYRDELVGLLESFEKKGHESDRSFYLEAWGGNSPYSFDRIGRGSVFIKNLCLSVFGTTQPDKMRFYLSKSLNGGNDGFIQRFQLMVYPDPVVAPYVDDYEDLHAKQLVQKIIYGLAEIEDFGSIVGAEQDTYDKSPAFRFDSDAQCIFIDWIIALEKDKHNDEYDEVFQQHLAKYNSLMPSLALIFHLINVINSPKLYYGSIKKGSALMAVKWCDYLKTHALRVYEGLGKQGVYGAVVLAERISEGKLAGTFKVRDIQQNKWAGLTDSKVIKKALQELEDKNWVISDHPTYNGFGRRPEAQYTVNPNALGFLGNGEETVL